MMKTFSASRSLAAASCVALALSLSPAPAAAQPMVYYGGRVISNVEVVQVAWTSGVDAMLVKDLATFYGALFATTYLDWLVEYDTLGKKGYVDGLPGSEQHIGRGTYAGDFTITPSNVKTALDNAEIATELGAQIASGALPAPKVDADGNVNTLYVIEFPSNYSITLFGLKSCQAFGGYHFTVTLSGKNVPFAVIPDCGVSFAQTTFVHTHELVEAITDMEAGLVQDPFAPTSRPIAWAAVAKNFWEAPESADICQNTAGEIAGYTVATNWSNFANDCVVDIPICDGIAAQPACRPCSPFDSGVGCSGATPACATDGPSAGQCVLCTKASRDVCTGSTPACDEATNMCVACRDDADCGGALGVCDVIDDAQKGECVGCNVDGDCAADQICDVHACVPDPTPPPDTGGPRLHDTDAGCACRAGGSSGDSGAGALLFAGLAGAVLGRRRARRG